jgi:hypothetical protein
MNCWSHLSQFKVPHVSMNRSTVVQEHFTRFFRESSALQRFLPFPECADSVVELELSSCRVQRLFG